MTTSGSDQPSESPEHSTAARLSLSSAIDPGRLNGAWWPRSKDLGAELTFLAAGLPAALGRVIQAVYSPADWEGAPRRVVAESGPVEVTSSLTGESHLVALTLSACKLNLLVVPPDTPVDQATEAMRVAASLENQAAADGILRAAVGKDRGTAPGEWHDSGDSWWAPNPVPPSFRRRPPRRSRPGRPRLHPEQDAAERKPVVFQEDDGAYTGHSDMGREWTITRETTGWRLSFQDTGDDVATNAGVHHSVAAAIAEANR